MTELPQVVIVQELPTAYLTAGVGPDVLLLHGWGAHSGLVWPLAQRLAHSGFRVYAPDLPGFGQTPTPPAPWSVWDYAAFTLAFLDALSLNAVYLFGHSFGGRLGLILGAKHADRIVKMALANSAGVRPTPPVAARLRLSIYQRALGLLRRLRLSYAADQLRAWYIERYGSADYKAASGVMRDTFVKVVTEDLLPCAAQVAVPTLLFWGDQDEETPLWQGRRLEQAIPDAGLVVFEGAGHYSYLDRLSDTLRVLNHFFQTDADAQRPSP